MPLSLNVTFSINLFLNLCDFVFPPSCHSGLVEMQLLSPYLSSASLLNWSTLSKFTFVSRFRHLGMEYFASWWLNETVKSRQPPLQRPAGSGWRRTGRTLTATRTTTTSPTPSTLWWIETRKRKRDLVTKKGAKWISWCLQRQRCRGHVKTKDDTL